MVLSGRAADPGRGDLDPDPTLGKKVPDPDLNWQNNPDPDPKYKKKHVGFILNLIAKIE